MNDEQDREERRADRELALRFHFRDSAFGLVRIVLYGAVLILAIKVSEPIARIFAGKSTTLVVDISIAFAVAASGAAAAGWGYGRHQKRRADESEMRLRESERQQENPRNFDDRP